MMELDQAILDSVSGGSGKTGCDPLAKCAP
jgi:hypothetical protein